MEKTAAIRLIENGIHKDSHIQRWVDLGAGAGLFTKALASLLYGESIIYAIDKDVEALKRIKLHEKNIVLKTLKKDFFNDALDLHDLDGILMANSLHFIDNKIGLLSTLKEALKVTGKFIFVEYDTDIPNPWVPYPVSYCSLEKLILKTGLRYVTKIGEVPSIYHQANLYCAVGAL